MAAEHKRLTNSTSYAVPAEQERIEVDEDDAEQESARVVGVAGHAQDQLAV